jgi:DNA replication protein DnaC
MQEAKRRTTAPSPEKSFDPKAWAEMRVRNYNRTPGTLTGYDCPKCLNRGQVMVAHEDGTTAVRRCECMILRSNLRRLERSGMKGLVERCTFEGFLTPQPWQQKAKALAMEYAQNPAGHWFLLSGQSGCGKTHLCTAICRELMSRGMETRYVLWRDTVQRLKALIKFPEEYGREMDRLKGVQVLYLDDFLKVGGNGRPSEGDLNLVFELLNVRYSDEGLLTVISTERPAVELTALDEAMGSRILERCGRYKLTFAGREKNFRVRGSL